MRNTARMYTSGLPDAPNLATLLREAVAARASDLHLSACCPPLLRMDGNLCSLPYAILSADRCESLCSEALGDALPDRLSTDIDRALALPGIGRFRASLFRQSGTVAGAFRVVPEDPPRLDELGLPAACASLVSLQSGLVLVTGATGSGKSTTLAALVAAIRATRAVHVLTIEDPIEFVHPRAPGLINQREIGRDAPSFVDALRHVLRQDPDVVLIGEMRDRETMRAALTLAETGHLVLSTLHSNSGVEAADRLIDAFPADEQGQVRHQVAAVLVAVIAQRLVPRRGGGGRVIACEFLVATPAIRNLIREAKTHQISSLVHSGQRTHGMQTMAAALAELVRRGTIADSTADSTGGAVRASMAASAARIGASEHSG